MGESCCGHEQPGEQPKKKGFLARWMEKLDKKLEAKSQEQGCCAKPKDGKKDSCC